MRSPLVKQSNICTTAIQLVVWTFRFQNVKIENQIVGKMFRQIDKVEEQSQNFY